MKKVLLLFAIVLVHITSFAYWNKGMIRIREENGRTLSVVIDGVRFAKIGRNITISNVRPGNHFLKIYAYNSNGYGYRQGMLLYQGNIMVKPGNIYYCSIYSNGMDIEENCCIDDYGHWNNNDYWENWDEENQCWNNNRRWNEPNPWNRRDNYYQNDWNNYSGEMSTGRYNQMIEQVRKTSFESSKVTLLNTMLTNTRITVNQMIGILRELSFESTRLQFAKDKFNLLTNRQNAFMICDMFTFQSSKDDFMRFIQRQTN